MGSRTSPERFRLIEDLFHRAQELPEDQRTAALDSWCGEDVDLRREVQSLLAAELEAGSAAGTAAVDPWIGRTIGRYRIERLLGRGGMGAVYLAAGSDGEIERRVALKVIGSRLVSQPLLESFVSERQILASLEHANIAALLDGGVTTTGDPYMVMEYVDGMRLDRWVQSRPFELKEILALFIEVCRAVEYAHRKLVVHRDIKPGNVLVTGDGRVKLVDFGTAKLLDPLSPENRSRFTRLGFRPLTPEFASPEQLAGEAVSTASDIFSLGVVLYFLLTGHTPFENLDSTPSSGSIIRPKSDPIAPSVALTRSVPTGSATWRTSEYRKRLRGDLDAITLKCLQRQPSGRYAAVSELISDIEAFLELRPISIAPPSFRYRAAKFVQRRRLEIAMTAAAVIALAGGAWSTTAAIGRSRFEADLAQQRIRDVHDLNRALLFDINDAIASLPDSDEVRKSILTESVVLLGKAGPPNTDAETQVELGQAYLQLGDLSRAEQTAESGLGRFPGDQRLERLRAVSRAPQGHVLEAATALEALNRAHPPSPAELADTAAVYCSAAESESHKPDAAPWRERCIQSARSALEANPGSPRAIDAFARAALLEASLSANSDLDAAVHALHSALSALRQSQSGTALGISRMRARARLLIALSRIGAIRRAPAEAVDAATQALTEIDRMRTLNPRDSEASRLRALALLWEPEPAPLPADQKAKALAQLPLPRCSSGQPVEELLDSALILRLRGAAEWTECAGMARGASLAPQTAQFLDRLNAGTWQPVSARRVRPE